MSIPGSAKEKYAHEVKFVGQNKCGWRKLGALVVLLMLGLLIYACCNISSMRSQMREMRRMMHEHRHNHHYHDTHNHGHHGHNHHDHHGQHHHHQRVRGNHHHQHQHPQPMPQPHFREPVPMPEPSHRRDCQGKVEVQFKKIGADLQERMADIDSFLETRIPVMERKLDQISKELLSKQDFSKRIYAKLNEFQTYLTSIVESLKISSWFS